jgi:hypothetical protein
MRGVLDMTVRSALRCSVIGVLACLLPAIGVAQDSNAPMSAIDWLSESVEITAEIPVEPPKIDEPAIAATADVPNVIVTALDNPSFDAVGLLPQSVTGLPRSLWRTSETDTLAALIAAQEVDSLPAMQDLLQTLLLSEADPPMDAGPEGQLYLARVDKLLDIGALDPAQAMLERAMPPQNASFRRLFDVALLTGNEDFVCEMLAQHPEISPTLPTRIFCLARNGDWSAAALTLNTAKVLGDVSDADDSLMSRFLDEELTEETPPLGPVTSATPLTFRMREAIGEALSTTNLPRAFAHADLRSSVGWKPQIGAVERLIRSGAIAPTQFFDVYTDRQPAASGGAWDRIEAFQKFEAAITARDPSAVSATLPNAWVAMQTVHAEQAFADFYADPLQGLPLSNAAAQIAFQVGLLSQDYETVARAEAPSIPHKAVLIAIATGEFDGVEVRTPLTHAIKAGFTDAVPPAALQTQIDTGQLGEAILRAMALFQNGTYGDMNQISDALALFRAVGLENTARRASLQILLLKRSS